MSAIFISYRREDAEDSARAVYESLVREFGKEQLFMDVEAIALGSDFRQAVDNSLDQCGIFLAIIGPAWLDARAHNDPSGPRRLDDPADYVRQEIATALKRGASLPVIPVLVRGATMPDTAKLPDGLKDLAYRNALTLSHLDWDGNMRKLVSAIRPHLSDDRNGQSGKAVQAKAEMLGSAASISVSSSPALAAGMKKAGIVAAVVVLGVVAWYIASRQINRRPGSNEVAASNLGQAKTGDRGPKGSPAASGPGEASGMPVLIVRNSRLANAGGPVNVLVDNVQQGQIRFDEHGNTPIQIHATEGRHQFMLANPQTKASCSGTFDVNASTPKLILRMRDNGTVCSLDPFSKSETE